MFFLKKKGRTGQKWFFEERNDTSTLTAAKTQSKYSIHTRGSAAAAPLPTRLLPYRPKKIKHPSLVNHKIGENLRDLRAISPSRISILLNPQSKNILIQT